MQIICPDQLCGGSEKHMFEKMLIHESIFMTFRTDSSESHATSTSTSTNTNRSLFFSDVPARSSFDSFLSIDARRSEFIWKPPLRARQFRYL